MEARGRVTGTLPARREELESTLAELSSFGRGETFPTLVVDDSSCVIGFRPDEIRRALTS
ncbi:MAG: hypothetical protein NTX23_01295 [Candidatus Bipolaricaulota bacterium]|nr:hypothetical protein [Candidatus Bipolaricaulota bacterium]